ncbi:hypothetical protein BX265_3745 [Streptomyces sp. TLI_235]|nr:hypothetical protein BX265_3745 [Streptomyces sp. TLI_235]
METRLVAVDEIPRNLSDSPWNASSVSLLPDRLGRPYSAAAWHSRVVLATRDGTVLGMLPVQRPKAGAGPGPVDPAALVPELFDGPAHAHLFLGGCTDLVSGAAVAAGLPPAEAAAVRRALVAAGREAALAEGLVPIALYVRDEEMGAFPAEDGWRAERIAQVSTIHVPADDAAYLAGLGASGRRTVLKDRRAAADCGLATAVRPAAEVVAEAAELVGQVKRRHGLADPVRLIRMRLAQWAADPVGERIAFAVSGPDGLLAVTLACVVGPRLEIYETGLVDEHEHRHEAYAESLFQAPVRHALAHGLTAVDLGLDAETPKTRRGAVLSPVWAVGPKP